MKGKYKWVNLQNTCQISKIFFEKEFLKAHMFYCDKVVAKCGKKSSFKSFFKRLCSSRKLVSEHEMSECFKYDLSVCKVM